MPFVFLNVLVIYLAAYIRHGKVFRVFVLFRFDSVPGVTVWNLPQTVAQMVKSAAK